MICALPTALATALADPSLLAPPLAVSASSAPAALAQTGADADLMHRVLFELRLNGFAWSITPWKLVGYLGVGLFGLRWVVQAMASRRARAPTMPLAFWLMSVAGSGMLLAYFIWGKNDSVGILSNLMPSLVYSYNLYLFFAARRRMQEGRLA